MTLNQLSYFSEIVKQRSFTKAAEVLFVSQSALSKSIRTLEKEFETTLIDRKAKVFTLTPEGELFYSFANRILGYYQEQSQILYDNIHGGCSTLSLGLPPSAGSIYFFDQIFRFKKKYSNIDLQITNATSKVLEEMVAEGKLDIGIVIEPFENDRFTKKKVFFSESVLVVSKEHPFANYKEMNGAELADQSFVTVSSDYMYYDLFINYCKMSGFSPKIAFETFQWDLLLEMVSANQGVTILPKPLVDKCYQTRVHQIHLKNPEFPWALTLIWRKEKFITEPMHRFIELCSENS